MPTPLYLSKPENIRYHTGFIGSFGTAIISKTGKKHLITDGRYTAQAKRICYPEVKIHIITDRSELQETVTRILQQAKITEIKFEATHLNYYSALALRRTFKQFRWLPGGKEIDQLRMQKSTTELKNLRKSQELNEKTLAKVLKVTKVGITESEIAWQIYKIGRELGSENTSFDPIVAFGKNSASPHYTPQSSRKLKKGDVVLIDMGLIYNGYCSDMTRTFFTNTPSNNQAEVYNTVLAAQTNAINNLRAGLRAAQGDKLSRSIIADAGYGEYFTHANGHGVGLEIHEAPSLSSKSKHKDRNITLQENMVVTVEPGIYLPEKFGVRIEDMVKITKSGTKNLTSFPKKLEEMIINV